ncbi:MAG: DUF3306 domain-containing protein [Shewanella sp.]|nr:DUF3306 domain-containing protein [Shewanella sp.]MCF1431360.1 DUF3306 domain-containing protein [Shewanella sp.]MCF1438598.1 DUF3306 domain-containing protein [Shewanella sp.]MCF1456725.1 DUF3306 domain-containing protein [Shewanella sp.]
MSDKSSGFFSRWQQRRDQVAQEAERAQQEPVVESSPLPEQPQPLANKAGDGERLLMEEDLPDPEQIELGGSFAAFMANNVDPTAKKAALRALWKQPHFNEVCRMAEYALDYSNQPLLSAADSAELVKKVFRKVIEREEQQEASQTEVASTKSAQSMQESLPEATEQPSEAVADTLPDENQSVNQDPPDESSVLRQTVGKGQLS